MVLVDKYEFFQKDDLETLGTSRTPETGKIAVEWTRHNGAECARIAPDSIEKMGNFLGGNYNGRMKMYFRNGYVWDTLLKPEPAWRRKIYEELKRYIDSNFEELPGEPPSEMSRAARLLDDEMQYEI